MSTGQIENIGRTAFVVSEVRAGEAERQPRLFDDPFAPLFSSPASKAAVQRAQQSLGPLFACSFRVRTRWFDDLLQRELARGTRQVLILGAGMDCRSLRFPRPGVTYFEVDAPSVLAIKAERLEQAGHPRGAVAIGTDYLAPGLFDLLAENGFDRALSTLVLWEGNVCYLPPDEMRRLLRSLGESIPDVRVAFDGFGTPIVEERSRVPALNQATALFRSMGAPWQCGIDDLPALAREANLRVLEEVSFGELMARLLPDQELGDAAAAEVFQCLLAR